MVKGPLGSLAGMQFKCCPNMRFFWMSSSAFQKAYSSAEELVVFSPTASLRYDAPQGSQACFYEGRQAACARSSLVASVLPSITLLPII